MNERLAQKIVENSKIYGINFKQKLWPKKLKSSRTYIDLEASVTVNGKCFFGFGTGTTEEIAIIKSTVEAIERAIVYESSSLSTTNGVAGHTITDSAKITASYELIERDAFLFHMITRQAPVIIKQELDNILINDIKSLGFDLVIKKLSTADSLIVLLMEAYKGGSVIIALGIGDCITSAVENTALQLIRIALEVENKLYEPLSLEQFIAQGHEDEMSHLKLGLSDDYSFKYRDWMNIKSSLINNLTLPEISHIELIAKSEPLTEICRKFNLVFFKAKSNLAQELFFGPTDVSLINKFKFNNLACPIERELIPHPLC